MLVHRPRRLRRILSAEDLVEGHVATSGVRLCETLQTNCREYYFRALGE
jgi:hypothetical protein